MPPFIATDTQTVWESLFVFTETGIPFSSFVSLIVFMELT